MRQAFAGMLWSKQFYHYNVATWLDGDPAQPAPPPERELNRNARWRNFDAFDILSMPDKWEYPWFAAWDLAFHCVTLAHVDPGFAKYQLVLLCREWFQHPNGSLPAYEWDFGDVNPPVQAWAALEVFALDGGKDLDFLARIFDKLLVNFTWWVNREDALGNNLFEGGFLGLDNIGPIDRSHLPAGTVLEQSDATGWMAFYALSMCRIALVLWRSGRRHGADLVLKFLEHYAGIAEALEGQGLWDEDDGMFYDHLCLTSGAVIPVKARSMVGMIPLLAVGVIDERMIGNALKFGKGFADFLERNGLADPDDRKDQGLLRPNHAEVAEHGERLLLSVVGVDRLGPAFRVAVRRVQVPVAVRPAQPERGAQGPALRAAPGGHERDDRLRARRVDHRHVRRQLELARADLVPAELPGDQLPAEVPQLLRRGLHRRVPDRVGEQAHAQGDRRRPAGAARLASSPRGADGRRPCYGWVDKLQHDPKWRDNIYFNEYYHGDNGAGLGASHQTGWTGLIADVIRRQYGAVPETADLIHDLLYPGDIA